MDLESTIKTAVNQAVKENINQIVSEVKQLLQPAKNELMNVDEVCEYLRLSRPTAYRLMKAGELKFNKIGSRTLFNRNDVEQLVNRK